LDYTVKPIANWPDKMRTSSQRNRSRFELSYAETLKQLERELSYLSARNVVFQLALDEFDIRRDGRPRADARPAHPGVIITFNSKYGPLSYWTDRYDRWWDNVRAIAESLEALRAVDRHGVSKQGLQYTGYKQLPPAEAGAPRRQMSEQEAAEFVSSAADGWRTAEEILRYEECFQSSYKRAAISLHPDRNQGRDADFIKLQEAAAVLKKRLA
jgi:hypothetical protein